MEKDSSIAFREAQTSDIAQMHVVRMAVRENILPDASLITAEDYAEFLTRRGKGWLCETENGIVGFAVVDLQENNIWALFVQPEYEGRGIGQRLHDRMLEWYFNQTDQTVWLGTSPETRAAEFYRNAGWTQTGTRPNGELRFEMTSENWKKRGVL